MFQKEQRPNSQRCAKTLATDGLFPEAHLQKGDDDLTYVGGWLVKDYVTCPSCKAYLSTSERSNFLKWKTYASAHTESLTAPSRSFMKHLVAWDNIFRKQMLKMPHKKTLLENWLNYLALTPYPCFVLHTQPCLRIFHIILLFFVYIPIANSQTST